MEADEDIVMLEEPINNQNLDLWSGGNYFNSHPEKVLGEKYATSGRFGQVFKYKGSLSDVERIDAPLNFFNFDKGQDDPTLSIVNAENTIKILDPDVTDFVEKAIVKSKARVSRKKDTPASLPDQSAPVELQSFYEVYEQYNPGITSNHLKAYLYWKTKIGKPLSRLWNSLVRGRDVYEGFTDVEMRETEPFNLSDSEIDSLVKEGHLFYYNGVLEPSSIYLSGDIYSKKAQLDKDKEYMESQFGPGTYDNHVSALETAWQRVYGSQIRIEAGNKGMVVLPSSSFAKKIKISNIELISESADKFKILQIGRKSGYGNPDWDAEFTKGYVSDWKKHDFEELSLIDACIFWILKTQPELNGPISHWDLVKIYYLDRPPRVSTDDKTPEQIKKEKTEVEKLKSICQREGNRLFNEFLITQLTSEDRVKVEMTWNREYNNYLPIDFNTVPVAFTSAKELIKPEKREAVAFIMSNGTGCLAYDVGVGKTPSAIFTISAFIDSGYTKRPMIVVPNQVYKQFISEIKKFAPHIPVIEGYNLSDKYVGNFQNEDGTIKMPPAGSITVFTYEGLEVIGFSDNTADELLKGLYEILNQGGESDRQTSGKNSKAPSFQERLEQLVGRGLRGTRFNIEDFGFDFACYDEAHKMKKVFTAVKGTEEETEGGTVKRGKNPYAINSGIPSSIALKGFMLNYYILQNNNLQNVMLLTATPFTNSPLEIFSMLAMVAYEKLKGSNLGNLKDFFDTFIQTSYELVITAKLKPAFKQVILGFNNLLALQSIIFRFINHKTGESVNVKRPQKYVLPYTRKVVDGTIIQLDESEKVETYIEMTPFQKEIMEGIVQYVEGSKSEQDLKSQFNVYEEEKKVKSKKSGEDSSALESGSSSDEGTEIDENTLDQSEKEGVRILKGLNMARNLALSPHVFQNASDVDYESYVDLSPKLKYIMNCVQSVKEYHEAKKEPISGQVIYMDRGVEHFGLLKKYLVEKVGFKEHEVGIIKSGLPKDGPRSKEYVKNLFNGERYNEDTKEFELVTDVERIKVVIGSSTIKEGINLQKYGTVLYNAFIDWNPTDIQQLEGRIYRQQNKYGSVRIVVPMVVDSADIFLFQKLQEKTARLNTIWDRDGKHNVLKTEEFDPSEFKYALIRNPYVVAELQIIEEKARMESEKIGFQRKVNAAQELMSQSRSVRGRFDNALKLIREYYPNYESTGTTLEDAKKLKNDLLALFKSSKDPQGLPWARGYYERRMQPVLYDKKGEIIPESELEQPSKPYWFTDWAVAIKDVEKGLNEFLRPFGIEWPDISDENPVQYFITKANQEIDNITEAMKTVESDENKNRIAAEVVEQREKNHIRPKNLFENVADFAKLNYLLSHKAQEVPAAVKKAATLVEVQPVDQEIPMGIPDISEKEYLENQIEEIKFLLEFADGEDKAYLENRIEDVKFLISIL